MKETTVYQKQKAKKREECLFGHFEKYMAHLAAFSAACSIVIRVTITYQTIFSFDVRMDTWYFLTVSSFLPDAFSFEYMG
jgi:hypothetical protein